MYLLIKILTQMTVAVSVVENEPSDLITCGEMDVGKLYSVL